MNKRIFMYATLVLISVLSIFAFSSTVIAGFNESHEAPAVDLTTLDAAEISAYRWNAMGHFYETHNESTDVPAVDLTTLDAAEISAYRWNAMGHYYETHNESNLSK
jgi:hypothetical protein